MTNTTWARLMTERDAERVIETGGREVAIRHSSDCPGDLRG